MKVKWFLLELVGVLIAYPCYGRAWQLHFGWESIAWISLASIGTSIIKESARRNS